MLFTECADKVLVETLTPCFSGLGKWIFQIEENGILTILLLEGQ